MIRYRQLIVVLDACVLYPAPVRDILLSLASEGLFIPRWSSKIQEEWVNNLLKNRKDLSRNSLASTVRAMNDAFPTANVTDFEDLISTIYLPDNDDRHVLACAIKSSASLIVTFNTKDFIKSELNKYGIRVLNPDDLISDFTDSDLAVCCLAFKKMVKRLKKPPMTKDQVLSILIKCNLSISANNLRRCF